jgi:hypothetical protein
MRYLYYTFLIITLQCEISLSAETIFRHQSASFVRLGKVSLTLEYGHVTAQVDINGAVDIYNAHMAQLEKTWTLSLKKFPLRSAPEINQKFTYLVNVVNRAGKGLRQLCDITSCNKTLLSPNLKRTKRFIGALLSGVSVGLSLYTLEEVYRLRANMATTGELKVVSSKVIEIAQAVTRNTISVQKLEKAMQQLIILDKKLAKRVHFEAAFFLHNSIVHDYSAELVRGIEAATQIILDRKLPPSLFDRDSLSEALQSISNQARKVKMELISSSLNDVFQEEITYEARLGFIEIIIHLPLRNIATFNAFFYPKQTLPLRNSSLVASLNEEEDRVLAISDTRTEAVTFSHVDLQACLRRHSTYLCPGHAILHKQASKTCLGAIYVNSAQGISTYCNFRISAPLEESVLQISETLIRLWSSKPITIELVCQNGTTHLQMCGDKEIAIEYGCELITPNTVYKRPNLYTFASKFDLRPLTIESQDIFDDFNAAEYETLLASIPIEANRGVDVRSLTRRLRNARRDTLHTSSSFVNLFILGLVTITVLVVLYKLIARRRRRKELERRGRKEHSLEKQYSSRY